VFHRRFFKFLGARDKGHGVTIRLIPHGPQGDAWVQCQYNAGKSKLRTYVLIMRIDDNEQEVAYIGDSPLEWFRASDGQNVELPTSEREQLARWLRAGLETLGYRVIAEAPWHRAEGPSSTMH
jgi:hypothetical protein